MEGLHVVMETTCENLQFCDVTPINGGTNLSHLIYVDDVILMGGTGPS